MTLLVALLIAVAVPHAEQLTLRGHIVCLDEAGHTSGCAADSRFALRDESGQLHHFDPADTRVPLFADERVRSRELEVYVWKRAGKLEIIKVYSFIDGERHLPHYFCDVCTITAYTGGPCWCCQKEFEFRETKVPE